MIHANRIVTVGDQESIIDRPIVLYRGDREVEIEFTLVGNEFTFSEEGNVIKSVNASHGQLVLNTPSGEHMFSELAECHEGKVVFVVTKEMIDEFIEMGFYSFQIRLYDSAEMKSRVTIPPVMNGFDIRNPIAAEDETNVVDQGIVDYARIFKDQSNEELPTFTWDGVYNKTEWAHHDVITENKMNKIEDALYSINANIKESDVVMLNTLDQVKKDADKYVKEHMAEVEQDVEDFERNLNTGVEKFKVDANAAMTAHKNEVSEELESVKSGLDNVRADLNTATIILTPEMYGCVGDGVTDDTINFQKCIDDAVKHGAMINGLGKTYMISDIQQLPASIESKDYGLYIVGSLYLYNCNFILKSGCLGRTSVLNIANPTGTRVVIDNVNIDANGRNQSTTVSSQDGGLHGLRVGYLNMGECGGFELLNSTVRNCYSDCMAVRSMKFDFFHVANCKIIEAGRNGITDNSHTSVIESTEFIDNGWRTPPNSGYHIEPDNSAEMGRKVMRDCIISNSVGSDYKVHLNTHTYNIDAIVVDNCTMDEFGYAMYCQTECYTNNIIVRNSKISQFTGGNGNNDLSLHVIRNIFIDNSKMHYVKFETTYNLTEATNIFINGCSFSSIIHLCGDYDKVRFNNCLFYKEVFEDADAVRNNVFYFDYQIAETLTVPQRTEEVSFTNCTFHKVNRCLALGDAEERTIKDFIFKNNVVYNRHLVMSGTSVQNAIIDSNIFRHIASTAAGTAGKIRFNSNNNCMIATNNIFFMTEIAAFGNAAAPPNCIKANNLFDITE